MSRHAARVYRLAKPSEMLYLFIGFRGQDSNQLRRCIRGLTTLLSIQISPPNGRLPCACSAMTHARWKSHSAVTLVLGYIAQDRMW